MIGWIKLHRNLKNWEWYDDINAMRLLIHLLISVNYEDKKWRGITIKAGSMILSWATLSESCGLTVKQCRGAMQKLEKSKEVARTTTNKYQLVTLLKWDKLQSNENKRASKRAGKGQSGGQAKGRQRATTKEYKEIEEVNNILLEKETKELFNDWIEYRKEIKKPIKSERTLIALAKKIKNQGFEKSKDVIRASIENQWQGLFWDKKNDDKKEKRDAMEMLIEKHNLQ